MHMSDALLSPVVGGAFLVVSGGMLGYSARRLGRTPDERRVPLMGVLGAFVFAAQMINFAIPGTGSSGHLGGGMLLAILLGPFAAFLVMASVLVVQCLFFLDGGILALGANVFNLGFWPCFLGFLIYGAIVGPRRTGRRLWLASVVAVVVSLEMGALGVVLQTILSGRTELPFGRFAALTMGIHLPIAVVEGAVTAAVVQYVWRLRPGVIEMGLAGAANGPASIARESLVPVVASLGGMAILLGCVIAHFASARPDGLEWSLERASGVVTVEESSPVPALERLQSKTAILPDYDFRSKRAAAAGAGEAAGESGQPWPAINAGRSVAGLVGAALTFAIVCVLAAGLVWLRPRTKTPSV